MLYLIRHCQSEGNADPSKYGEKPDKEIDLTPEGHRHARKVASLLWDRIEGKPVIAYSSTFLRAKMTAKPFASLGKITVTEHPLVHERAWGALRTKVTAGSHSRDDFGFFRRHDGGESFADLENRVRVFFAELRQNHDPGETIVVFTHGEWIKIAKKVAGGQSIEEFEKTARQKIPNGEIVSLGDILKNRNCGLPRRLKVYLDDERPTPEGWIAARWPNDVIAHLETGNVAEISLDHDLGDDRRGTGYDVLTWIEKAVVTKGFLPPKIRIHTGNPAAKARMEAAGRSIKKRTEEIHDNKPLP